MRSLWPRACAWTRHQWSSARTLMVCYVVLYQAPWFVSGPWHHPVDVLWLVIWLLIVMFLAWRTCRGGRVSRGLLLALTGLNYLVTALRVARAWDAGVLILLGISAIQFALLVSPAVWHVTHSDTSAGMWDGRRKRRAPQAWVLLGGLAGGFAITLLYLTSADFQPIPGCGRADAPPSRLPDQCITLGRGYPLRFLIADQGIPLINQAALLRDLAQWSLISSSVLYVVSRSDKQYRATADLERVKLERLDRPAARNCPARSPAGPG